MKAIEDFLTYCEEGVEQKGKDDSLINIDSSFMFDNMKLIVQEIVVKLLPIKIYYENYIADTDTKIENFKRFGLVDTVEQFSTQRKIAENELQLCRGFETHLKNTLDAYHQNGGDIRKMDWGVAQIKMSSYAYGFQKGLTDTIN